MTGEADARVFRLADTHWLEAPARQTLMNMLDIAEIPFRLVGGCVRDALAGRKIKDLDLATPKDPQSVMDRLRAAGVKVVPTGIRHGTVTAVVAGQPFEITTLRRDVETDGRHAVVAFTDDWRADAMRRDLTINAMSCDRDGMVHDYFGGFEDLRAGRVRFVGNAATRIDEDVLRLLRFFRFFGDFGRPPPDVAALEACRSRAHKLPSLSGERVRQEMLRILGLATAADVIDVMAQSGVFPYILPEIGATETLRRLVAGAPGADPLLRLGVLLRAGKGGANAVAERLKMSRAERKRLLDLEQAQPVDADMSGDALRGLAYRHGMQGARDRLLLALAERGLDVKGWLDAMADWPPIQFPLRPRDLLGLGMEEGPELGRLYRRVEDWWVDAGCRADRAACLERAGAVINGEG